MTKRMVMEHDPKYAVEVFFAYARALEFLSNNKIKCLDFEEDIEQMLEQMAAEELLGVRLTLWGDVRGC